MHLIHTLIHSALKSTEDSRFKRKAARAVVQRDNQILLLFTERYNANLKQTSHTRND